jgi:chromate transport protein ChrA
MFNGFKCVAIAIVLQAFWGLSEKYRKDIDSIAMFMTCAIVYFLVPNALCMFFLFTISAMYCVIYKQIDIKDSKT